MCLVTIAVWALSDFRTTRVLSQSKHDRIHLLFENSIVGLVGDQDPPGWGTIPSGYAFELSNMRMVGNGDVWLRLGDRYIVVERILIIAAWSLVLLFGCYPTLALIRDPLRRYRRRRRGLCIRCGYHLEGNVSGVCSECGEAT